jgi:hypothetical protein
VTGDVYTGERTDQLKEWMILAAETMERTDDDARKGSVATARVRESRTCCQRVVV